MATHGQPSPPSRALPRRLNQPPLVALATAALLLLLVTHASAFHRDAAIRAVSSSPAPALSRRRRSTSQQQQQLRDRLGLTTTTQHSTLPTPTPLCMENKKYGRGAEIWPPTNEEPVLLADSFPGGVVPSIALVDSLDDDDSSSSSSSTLTATDDPNDGAPTAPISSTEAPPPRRGRKRKLIRGAVSRVLRGAAASQQTVATGDRSARGGDDAFWDAPVDRSPAVVAAILLGCGLVKVTDVMAVVGLTAYLVVLGLTGSSPQEGAESLSGGGGGSGGRVMLPSLPPRGHVPNLVSNPLGTALTNSAAYRTWLRLGAVVGLLLPLGALGYYGLGPRKDMVAAGAVARPVFLICCQAVSEAASRRLLAPLPLRILIPAAYSAIRLGPLWDWALCPTPLGYAGRVLAATNYLYWTVNLFGFLLPIGAIRYMRAHFFCVEAAEVTLREGGETSAGLLS